MSLLENTLKNKKINNHIKYGGGVKTVCVSTCLSFFGVQPNTYHYTSSPSNISAYENVLRRNGFSVRSRMTEFKIKKGVSTMTFLLTMLKKSDYTVSDYFIVCGEQSTCAHLMVVNGIGEVIIDTAPKKRWKVRNVRFVNKMESKSNSNNESNNESNSNILK
jgi:hypothetical protein